MQADTGITRPAGLRLWWRRLAKAPLWAVLMAGRLRPAKRPAPFAMSMELCRNPVLAIALGQRPRFYSRLLPAHPAKAIGWGRRWSGRRAQALSAHSGCGLLLLEDGFLRSFRRDDPARSIVMDDQGIYYDARTPSRLERLIAQPLMTAQIARADALVTTWRRFGLSKYNAAPDYTGQLPARYVLLADQVPGDLSIAGGMADAARFQQMLAAALDEHPAATIIIKAHPDVASRKGAGHFERDALANQPRVQLITEACHPAGLIANADAVYCVSSQIGFEALLAGRPVRCFGMPFYAGWGLTQDEMIPPARRGKASLPQLVHAALVDYPTYCDAQFTQASTPEAAMADIAAQRAQTLDDPPEAWAIGFSRWKRRHLRAFMPRTRLHFLPTGQRVPDGATVVLWGATPLPDRAKPARVLRVEDGFLRSAGLGAELVAPRSWVVDDLGLYYDASRPSRLEKLLQDGQPDEAMLARAAALRAEILEAGLSKYNLGGRNWRRPAHATRVVLVPGQVEGDQSLKLGGDVLRSNLGLLKAVRQANPDAYILYKPHPDVLAGLRAAGLDEASVGPYCDEIVGDYETASLLRQVDEVHVMTSLIGFEALLRGLAVHCYGQPFYAGWGLTLDATPIARRTAQLSLDALVAGVLIAYPRYLSGTAGALCAAETAVAGLAAARATGPKRAALWRRARRRVLRLWARRGERQARHG